MRSPAQVSIESRNLLTRHEGHQTVLISAQHLDGVSKEHDAFLHEEHLEEDQRAVAELADQLADVGACQSVKVPRRVIAASGLRLPM
jgi:hypothetical protein